MTKTTMKFCDVLSYEEAKAERDLIDQEVSAAAAIMEAFPRGPMNLPSEAVRFSPEYRVARATLARAFKRLQDLACG